MGISSGIALIVLGAILAFAVELDVAGININTVGLILMIGGVIAVVLDLVYFAPRRRGTTVVERERL